MIEKSPPACNRADKLPTLPKCDWDEDYPPEVVLAMNSANASLATTEELLSGTLHAIENESKRFLPERKLILSNDDGTPMTSVTWNPTWNSAQLMATIGVNVELLVSNINKNKEGYSVGLAVLGKRRGSRYVAFGGNPFSEANNEQMNTLLRNTIRWLAKTTGNHPITLRFAHLAETHWWRHESNSRAWLDKNMPEVRYNGRPGQCDPNANAKKKGPCCSSRGWCGNSDAHCKCGGCIDYRNIMPGM